MPLSVCPLPVAEDRWAREMERHAVDSILRGKTATEIRRGLTLLSGDIRTVHHTHGKGLGVTLSLPIRQHLGVDAGDSVQCVPNDDGTATLRRVDPATLTDLERIGFDRSQSFLAATRPKPRLAHHELQCHQCRRLFCWGSKRKRFCDKCRSARDAECKRRWQRKRKRAEAATRTQSAIAPRHAVTACKTGRQHTRKTKREPPPSSQLRGRTDQRSARKGR